LRRRSDLAGGRSGTTRSSAPASATTAAASATTTFGAVADAYVDHSKATTSFATATTRRTDASAPIQLSYLRFDGSRLAGVPRRAVLRVYANSGRLRRLRGARHGLARAWGRCDRLRERAVAGGDRDRVVGGCHGRQLNDVDVTPLVISFALKTISATGLGLASREATADKRPELVVTP
jgi:hypothetical protein